MAAQASTHFAFHKLRSGMKARVVKLEKSSESLRRLQEMGLTVGTTFRVVKVAPFGDPMEIDVRGYRLCLRKKETVGIEIEPVA
jgi:ferrous iron transport protein A